MTETYKIIRFYFQDYDPLVIKTGLTLDEARKHCLDPETSSRTAKSKKAQAITKKYGEWFDGYEKDEM